MTSSPALQAFHLAADLLFVELVVAVDIPRVHDHTDAPSHDGEHGPEEPVNVGQSPDHHEERVDQEIDQKMPREIAPLLEALDRPLAKDLATDVLIDRHLTSLLAPDATAREIMAQGRWSPIESDERPIERPSTESAFRSPAPWFEHLVRCEAISCTVPAVPGPRAVCALTTAVYGMGDDEMVFLFGLASSMPPPTACPRTARAGVSLLSHDEDRALRQVQHAM